uniref:Uncharacterized protein n=1 Tax=Cucumis melo TaxID=3656 RepID=A0A9I9EAF7_CUCME
MPFPPWRNWKNLEKIETNNACICDMVLGTGERHLQDDAKEAIDIASRAHKSRPQVSLEKCPERVNTAHIKQEEVYEELTSVESRSTNSFEDSDR